MRHVVVAGFADGVHQYEQELNQVKTEYEHREQLLRRQMEACNSDNSAQVEALKLSVCCAHAPCCAILFSRVTLNSNSCLNPCTHVADFAIGDKEPQTASEAEAGVPGCMEYIAIYGCVDMWRGCMCACINGCMVHSCMPVWVRWSVYVCGCMVV